MISIRASSLDDAADCPRRHALRMFREVQQRYEGKPLRSAIGALVGKAVHAAVVQMWRGMAGPKAEESALAEYATDSLEGVTLDAITPSLYAGSRQVARSIGIYRARVMPRIKPGIIEQQLAATVSPGIELSGSPDMVTADHVLRDLKNEIRSRPHINQIGAYALLLHSHGHRVEHAVIDHIKRQSQSQMRTKPPHYEEIEYGVSVVEASAHDVVMRTAHSLAEYSQRELDKDPQSYLAFRANPSSVLCSAKYCPAWNTRWCREGAIAHGEKQDA